MALLLILIVSVLARNMEAIETAAQPVQGQIVVIDAGHGKIEGRPNEFGLDN